MYWTCAKESGIMTEKVKKRNERIKITSWKTSRRGNKLANTEPDKPNFYDGLAIRRRGSSIQKNEKLLCYLLP